MASLHRSVARERHPRVLVVHNRYRAVGGEERSAELQLQAMERAGIPHATYERRSADSGRAGGGDRDAARGLGRARGRGGRARAGRGRRPLPQRAAADRAARPAGGGRGRGEGGAPSAQRAPVLRHRSRHARRRAVRALPRAQHPPRSAAQLPRLGPGGGGVRRGPGAAPAEGARRRGQVRGAGRCRRGRARPPRPGARPGDHPRLTTSPPASSPRRPGPARAATRW